LRFGFGFYIRPQALEVSDERNDLPFFELVVFDALFTEIGCD